MEFFDALRERGVPEENIARMIEEKVDQDIMPAIDEDTLSRYIPHLGDRVFARNWTSGERNEERKRILVDRIRSKMRLPSTSSPSPTATRSRSRIGVGNRNAERETRKIEVGWMNYHNGVMKQVRRPTGGGTRDIIVRKNDTMKKILEDAKKMFFPNGKSTKGHMDEFEFSLCVMGSGEPLEDTLTVGSVYETTHHKLLRLYVCSKRKDVETSTDLNATPQSPTQDSPHAESPCTSVSNTTSTPDSLSPHALSSTLSQLSPIMPAPVSEIGQLVSTPSPHMPACEIPQSNEEDEEIIFLSDPRDVSCDDTNDTLVYEPQIAPMPTFGNLLTNFLAENVVDETCDANSNSFFEDPENVAEKQLLTIRSANCIADMIIAFSDPNILDANITFQRVLENGDIENGVGRGLVLDCLTDFWSKFYLARTSGTTFKVPNLHHTYKEREWEAVARIVAFGWKYKYLPVQLARPFLLEVFSINPSTSSSTLMEAFFNYISPNEKDALTEALNDFPNADFDELLTILGSHNCTTLPTEQNLSKLLDEIAHKELVQEPAFIIKCWKPILKVITERDSFTAVAMEKILDDLKPKARNLTKTIHFPHEMSQAERTTSLHLLRFVRQMDAQEIGLFLRFCTGSDLFLSKTIQVTFTNMSNFERRPVAHTCSCSLELASTYASFAEFRTEFLGVLKSGIWVMDMA